MLHLSRENPRFVETDWKGRKRDSAPSPRSGKWKKGQPRSWPKNRPPFLVEAGSFLELREITWVELCACRRTVEGNKCRQPLLYFITRGPWCNATIVTLIPFPPVFFAGYRWRRLFARSTLTISLFLFLFRDHCLRANILDTFAES